MSKPDRHGAPGSPGSDGVRSTHRLFERIAVVFDFDDTLAPDTMSGLVERLGVPPDHFWQDLVQPLVEDEGWDPIPAAFFQLIELSRSGDPRQRVTRERLAEHGREISLFEGVESLFERLRAAACAVVPQLRVDFYVVSAGLGDIIRATPIAPRLEQIWACELHFGADGGADFIKRLVTHTEKTRCLFEIAKGLEHEGTGRGFDVHRALQESELALPLDQMIYVGDGFTDVPCFSVMNQNNGISMGLFKENTPRRWGAELGIQRGQRVANLARPDFREDSELSRSLVLAVEAIAKRIAVRQLAVGE